MAVWQLVAGSVAVQRVAPPEVKVTVPVAPAGNPAMESVSCDPKPIDGGDADSVIDVPALVTVKLAPVAVAPAKLASPEYVAVTGYTPGTRVLDVAQLVAGRVAGERGFARAAQPRDNDHLVARDGDGDVFEIMLAGAADSVIAMLARVTVKLAPDAVVPL